MKNKLPVFRTDEEAEHFVETADLTEYDLSGGRRFGSLRQFAEWTKQVVREAATARKDDQ